MKYLVILFILCIILLWILFNMVHVVLSTHDHMIHIIEHSRWSLDWEWVEWFLPDNIADRSKRVTEHVSDTVVQECKDMFVVMKWQQHHLCIVMRVYSRINWRRTRMMAPTYVYKWESVRETCFVSIFSISFITFTNEITIPHTLQKSSSSLSFYAFWTFFTSISPFQTFNNNFFCFNSTNRYDFKHSHQQCRLSWPVFGH